ncbi:MAG: hypothetical protein AAF702_46785 [Chloroflexota bacterium]
MWWYVISSKAVEAVTDPEERKKTRAFYFKGSNNRWKDVLSEAEVAMSEAAKAQILTPDCVQWLEQGRAALWE